MRNRNWFWGLFFIVGGVLLLAQAFNLTFGLNIWQIFVVILMLSITLKSLPRMEFFGILLPLPFIYMVTKNFFPAPYNDLSSFTLIMVAVFLALGLSIIFRRPKVSINFDRSGSNYHSIKRNKGSREQLSGEEVYSSVSFGDSVKYVYSDSLRRAEFDCSFGNMKIYFDEAIIADGVAEIFVDCSFGAMELYLPHEWNVITEIEQSLGGFNAQPGSGYSDGPTVYIRGDVSFGDIKILRI